MPAQHQHGLEDRGLGLCTESLGSESSGYLEEAGETVSSMSDAKAVAARRPEKPARKPPEEFPAPLPSLALQGGGFLRAERKYGRLLLREVVVQQRPEIFVASRENGRLKLQLVPLTWEDHDDGDEEEDEAVESSSSMELPEGRRHERSWEGRCLDAMGGVRRGGGDDYPNMFWQSPQYHMMAA